MQGTSRAGLKRLCNFSPCSLCKAEKTKRVQQNKEGLRFFARAFFFMNTLQDTPYVSRGDGYSKGLTPRRIFYILNIS